VRRVSTFLEELARLNRAHSSVEGVVRNVERLPVVDCPDTKRSSRTPSSSTVTTSRSAITNWMSLCDWVKVGALRLVLGVGKMVDG